MRTTNSSRDIYDRARTKNSDSTVGARSKSIDTRYQPTRASSDVAPTASNYGSRATTRATTGATKSDVSRTLSTRGNVKSTTAADGRIGPADTVRANSRPANGRSKTAAGTAAIGSNTIVRSSDAPRLNPRSIDRGVVGIGSPRSSISGSVHVYDPWCNPYPTNCGWNSAYSVNCGYSAWHCNFSLWYPCFWGYSSLWNSCHYDWWWNCSSSYYCGSSYWWYPSSVYCPTYLYVPSSVVVASSGDYGAPVAEPAPAEAAPPAAGERAAPRTLAEKYLELGDFYFRAGRFKEAAETYARARTYAPNDAGVHFVLADAAFANGDYHFAAFLITEALRLDAELAKSEVDKRDFYGDPKLFDEQMEALDAYLKERPDDASAHLVRGYNLRLSAQSVRAIVAFRRVLELAPEDRAAALFLDALEAPAKASPAGEGSGR